MTKLEIKIAARQVIKELRLNRVPVPARISFEKLEEGTPSLYAMANDEIFIDDRSPFWKNPAIEAAKRFDIGWWSTSNALHPIIHEIGHEAHYKSAPRIYFSRSLERWTSVEFSKISGKVSKYAETDPSEFVAEVFAGLVDGIEYDPQVMAVYRTLQGYSL